MVEKRIVVDGLKFTYNGAFKVTDFYKSVEDWIVKNKMQKETKNKLQHNSAKGRKLEWLIEIWENPTDYAKTIVRLRALFNNVKDVKINGKNMNSGEIMIVVDGFLETDVVGKWHQKPTHFFLRAIIDKYIKRIYGNKFDGKLAADSYALKNYLVDFFKQYK